jgi:hypothetical protein
MNPLFRLKGVSGSVISRVIGMACASLINVCLIGVFLYNPNLVSLYGSGASVLS